MTRMLRWRAIRRDRQGRQGGAVALYKRGKLDYTALAIRDDKIEGLWMKIKDIAKQMSSQASTIESPLKIMAWISYSMGSWGNSWD